MKNWKYPRSSRRSDNGEESGCCVRSAQPSGNSKKVRFLKCFKTLDERLYHACSSDVSGTGPAEKLHFLSFVVEEGLSISDSVKYLLQNESH